MSPLVLLALAVGIVLLGTLTYWLANRRSLSPAPNPPPPDVAAMGYGAERWERDLALWRGTLRRLEIQAKHQQPLPERLRQEIAEAQARIAAAEARLGRGE